MLFTKYMANINRLNLFIYPGVNYMATTLGSYLYSERLRYGTILILTISALTYLSIIYLLLSSVKTELVVRTFFSQEFISALMLSFFGALISSLLVFPLAIFTAYILARSNSFLSLLTESMLTTPYTLTPVAVGGLVLLFITQTPIGHLINKNMNLLFTLNGIIFIQAITLFLSNDFSNDTYFQEYQC